LERGCFPATPPNKILENEIQFRTREFIYICYILQGFERNLTKFKHKNKLTVHAAARAVIVLEEVVVFIVHDILLVARVSGQARGLLLHGTVGPVLS
jgi:hypothetical protein